MSSAFAVVTGRMKGYERTNMKREDQDKPMDLRTRTKRLALRVLRLCDALPRTRSGNVVANQLVRAGTSPGAQYREGQRSRSVAESISKLQAVLQELDETDYWLEIAEEHKLLPARRLEPLRKEVNELIAIFVACVRKLYRLKKPRRSRTEDSGRTEG